MPDSAVTPNVFLDTQVYDAHKLDFANQNLQRLMRLVSEGTVKLFLTSVTEREIRKHIDQRAQETSKQIKDISRVTQFVRRALPEAVVQAIQGFDPDAFRAKLHKEFDEFIGRGGIVRLSLDSVSPETVFEKYFSQSGTFGAADKKAEFPDAFSLAALEAWCHTNKAKVYAVSGDEDWKRGCDGHATVLHVERLEKVLELFSDSIVVHAIKAAVFDMNEELTSLIEAKVETIDIYFADEDTTPNAEIVGVTMEGEEFHYPNVVEIGDTTAVLVLDYTYNLMIDVVCDDITSKLDLAKYRFEKCLSGTIYRSLETDITIQVAFSRDKPEELRFLSVELSNDILPIEIEEGELGPEEPSR